MTQAKQKLVFVDAETAFKIPGLGINSPADADPWSVAKTVRALSTLCPKNVKVLLVVQSSAEAEIKIEEQKASEEKKVAEFNEKEKRLSLAFFDSKEIVSEVPLEKSGANIYKNILMHKNVSAEDTVYLTAASEVDPRVLAANLPIIQVSEEVNLWRTLKTLAFRD